MLKRSVYGGLKEVRNKPNRYLGEMSAEQRTAGAKAPGGHMPSVFTAQQSESRWKEGTASRW